LRRYVKSQRLDRDISVGAMDKSVVCTVQQMWGISKYSKKKILDISKSSE